MAAAYGRKMTVEGPAYRERQKERVQCGECRKEMAAGLLASHRVTQHGRAAEERWSWEASATGSEPQTYQMAFPTKGGPQSCPVEGCPGQAGTRTAMMMHFFNRYVRDIVIILKEGNLSHPRCPRYNMLVPWRALNGRDHATEQCKKGAERKRRQMAEEESRDSTERAFEAYGKPLETVLTFKCLGRVTTAGDDDWPEVAGNMVKARKSWGRLSRILSQEGANKRVLGNFFKAVVQTVLLFGEETWVLNPRIERALERFQHGAALRITGIQPWRRRDGQWTYPPLK